MSTTRKKQPNLVLPLPPHQLGFAVHPPPASQRAPDTAVTLSTSALIPISSFLTPTLLQLHSLQQYISNFSYQLRVIQQRRHW